MRGILCALPVALMCLREYNFRLRIMMRWDARRVEREAVCGTTILLGMPHPAILAAVAVIGVVVGSFLNVVIARLPNDESIVTPRSKCPACSASLRWYDNIPLLSWVLLRGRCRDCNARISWRYPAVELAVALWFALCFVAPAKLLTMRAVMLSVDMPATGIPQMFLQRSEAAVLGCFLIALMVIDWKHHRLPDGLTLGGIATGLFFACVEAIFLDDGQADVVLQHPIHLNAASSGRSTGNIFLTGPEHIVFGRLFAAVAAFLLLYLIRTLYKAIRKRDGMGLGDAKLLAMIASFIGLAPTAVALAGGILFATMYAVVLLVAKRANATTQLPFGSFLAAAGLLATLYGQRLADAYLALFH